MQTMYKLLSFEFRHYTIKFWLVFAVFTLIYFALTQVVLTEGEQVFINYFFETVILLYLLFGAARFGPNQRNYFNWGLMEYAPSFYTYKRKLPVEERLLYYSQALLYVLKSWMVLVFALIGAGLLLSLPFLSLLSYAILWFGITTLSAVNAIEDLAGESRKRFISFRMVGFIAFIVSYSLLGFMTFSRVGMTLHQYTVQLAKEQPAMATVIGILMIVVILAFIVVIGKWKIKRKVGSYGTADRN